MNITKNQAKIIVCFADNNMKIKGTAEQLFYHKNSVLYHLLKIKENTGADPRNFHDLCRLLPVAKEVLQNDA